MTAVKIGEGILASLPGNRLLVAASINVDQVHFRTDNRSALRIANSSKDGAGYGGLATGDRCRQHDHREHTKCETDWRFDHLVLVPIQLENIIETIQWTPFTTLRDRCQEQLSLRTNWVVARQRQRQVSFLESIQAARFHAILTLPDGEKFNPKAYTAPIGERLVNPLYRRYAAR